jgi:hypothetical protein
MADMTEASFDMANSQMIELYLKQGNNAAVGAIIARNFTAFDHNHPTSKQQDISSYRSCPTA